MPAQRHRQTPTQSILFPQVPLCNWLEALEPEGEVSEDAGGNLPVRLPRVRRSSPHLQTASTRKDRWVIIVGESLLRGTEGPICWPDPTSREVRCLPGVWDMSRKLPSLIHPSDYYPLLIVQAGSNEVTDSSQRIIKNYFRRLGWLADGVGIQLVFSSIP